MRVIQIGEDDPANRWDAYVEPRTGAVTDLFAWRRIVGTTYGLRSHFYAAEEDGRIAGTLALYEVRHPVFGHYLATAPFGNDGGLHFDDAAARELLLREARDLADRLNVAYLVIRTRGVELEGFCVDSHYRTAVINLSGGAEEIWNARLPAKTRNQIRRGMKEGFSVESGPGLLETFHSVFHRHMRDLGSPAHSIHFYQSIIKHLRDRAEFFIVREGTELVAGALLFRVNDVAMNLHTVALRKYNRRCPNYLIYWKMIEASCTRGCKRFDMGRSESDSPTLNFKSNWNPELVPLSYNYYLRRLQQPPYLDPRNPKYRIPIAVWRKLPLFATKTLGPQLIRGLV